MPETQSKQRLTDRGRRSGLPGGGTGGGEWLRREPRKPEERVLRVGRVLVVLLSIALVGLLGRVVQLQGWPSEPIARLIDTQHSKTTLHGRRGNLLDRRGRVLASTRLSKRLYVDPQQIEDPGTFAEQVGHALGYDPAWLEKRISQRERSRYVVIDQRLSDERVEKLNGIRLKGLATEWRAVRDYPYESLAGQVLGFVGLDELGLEGLERVFEKRLTGARGRLGYLRDAQRRPLWVEQEGYQPPDDGRAVRTSLDATIQGIAEEELGRVCGEFRAAGGQIIVMEPHTGEILAMANYPLFDPNSFIHSKPEVRRNRCVTDVYEPGSTFKVFVWSAATEMGLARPNEVIDCSDKGFYVSPQGRRLRDVHGHGRITWDEVLVKSSNIGMAIVGQRMTATQMHGAVRAFGFGGLPGSRLPGESPGILRSVKKWTHYSITSVPMGQEIGVTGLQLVRAFSVIANGGYLVTPTIVVQRDGEQQVEGRSQIYERVLSGATAEHARQVLRRVVTEGTGRKADSELYEIFGKTGTAQVADRVHGGYLAGEYVSSFVAGAPLDGSRIVVACIIHQPDRKKGYYGGLVAAPAAMRVIEKTLTYMGVPTSPREPKKPGVQLASN